MIKLHTSSCAHNCKLAYFIQHVPVRILRQRIKAGLQPPTNFATVVTDLTTCHNTWFYSGVDRCYVATQETKQQALSLGLVVRLHGHVALNLAA
jgi:Monogalactosyldiacylglycerol (MGDG) synthase